MKTKFIIEVKDGTVAAVHSNEDIYNKIVDHDEPNHEFNVKPSVYQWYESDSVVPTEELNGLADTLSIEG